MKYIYTILSLALLTCCNMPVETETDTGEPDGPHTSSEWQIWAYSTAAPDYIAADATVFDGPPDMGCLLYTSPSPRDRIRSRMPSSA